MQDWPANRIEELLPSNVAGGSAAEQAMARSAALRQLLDHD
jgi:hypothetical protein